MSSRSGEGSDDERTARVTQKVDAIFEQLDDLLKTPDVEQVLAERRVNASIAMLVADGLRAYLQGDREKAIEDLSVAAEEVAQRYAQAAKGEA